MRQAASNTLAGLRRRAVRRGGGTARRTAAALFLVVPLAACQQGPLTTASVPLSVEERHPIGVVPERVVLDVAVVGGGIGSGTAAELSSFVVAYGQEGSGALYVLAPNDGSDRRAAELVYAEARRVAQASGIPVSAIAYAGYAPAVVPAPVKLLYERMVAATTCGQWPQDAGMGPRNEPYFNYGCATQKNLGAMVEDPRDLESPRPTTSRDATRRDVVIRKYRSGEATGTQYEDQNAGQASDVGG